MTALVPSAHAQQLGAHWLGCEHGSPVAAFPKMVVSSVQVAPPRASVASCQSGVMFVGVRVHDIGDGLGGLVGCDSVDEGGAGGGDATTCGSWCGSAGGGRFVQARKAAVDASKATARWIRIAVGSFSKCSSIFIFSALHGGGNSALHGGGNGRDAVALP